MTEYIIQYNCKEYKKASPNLKKALEKGMEKLRDMIKDKEEHGEPFEKIFNNDAIKAHVLTDHCCTFKFHYADSTQLRMLYEFRRDGNKVILTLHKFFEKRRTVKPYINDFKEYAKKIEENYKGK